MYCSSCGKADQDPDTYCRQCGNYLPDPESRRRRAKTPAQQFRLSLVFNILSGLVAFGMATVLFLYHVDMEYVPPVIWAAMIFLYIIGVWQVISFINNLNLRKRFIKGELDADRGGPVKDAGMTKRDQVQLPEADFSDVVPPSIVEGTTRKLKQKAPRDRED